MFVLFALYVSSVEYHKRKQLYFCDHRLTRFTAVYLVALKQPSVSYLVVNHRTAEILVTSDTYLKYMFTSVSKRIRTLVRVYL